MIIFFNVTTKSKEFFLMEYLSVNYKLFIHAHNFYLCAIFTTLFIAIKSLIKCTLGSILSNNPSLQETCHSHDIAAVSK